MDKNLILSCKIPHGKKGIIRKLEGPNYFVSRLREMGFAEGMVVSKVSDDAHRCIVLNVKGKKYYLNEQAAHCIFVELQ